MAIFYVMTSNGKTPPKYMHATLESAAIEAQRLSEQFESDAMILEVVGEVKRVSVPVTKKVSQLTLKTGYLKELDDLPF